MSIEINIDEEIFGLLQSRAQPFVDTPNTVLRRLLGLATEPEGLAGRTDAGPTAHQKERHVKRIEPRKRRAPTRATPKRTRVPSGALLPESRYELPLLRALAEAGGRGPSKEVIESVGRELKDDLMPMDLETLTSGSVRWQSRIQFVRLRLIERGLMDRNTPRGVWGITDRGRDALAAGRTG